MDRIPRYEETWSDTDDTSRVEQSFKGIHMNNSTTVIYIVGNRGKIGEILEDLKLVPYENWLEMEQY